MDSTCKVQLEKTSSSEATSLTVGQIFALNCDGDWSRFDNQQAELKLSEPDLHKLKLLTADFSNSGAKLLVASYVPGKHQLSALSLTSGAESSSLNGVNFEVVSVIDPQAPKTEPFGPLGPLGLSMPWWYFAGIAVFVLLVLALVFQRWLRWRQRQKLIQEMEAQGAAMDPFPQFNQALRRMQRQYPFLDSAQEADASLKLDFINELEKSYRTYLGRTFLIPTFAWRDSTILRELKSSSKKIYQEQGAVVDRLLREFHQAKEQKEKVKNHDLRQLLDLSRKNIDEIFVLKKGLGK